MKLVVVVAGVLCSTSLFSALEPLAPTEGTIVQLVPDAQRKVMALPALSERIRLLEDDRKANEVPDPDRRWRRAKPLVLELRATEGEKGPWKVEVGKNVDLADARIWYVPAFGTGLVTGRSVASSVTQDVVKITLWNANLEIATRYYWRVSYRGRCGDGCGPKHGCDACKKSSSSPVVAFDTEDLAPRWIAVEGDVANMRDLGGRLGLGGRRVRQGLVYRGQAFNDNSVTGERRGRNRLMPEDVEYLTGTLGIRTDLDLRSHEETADLVVSPLGNTTRFIQHSSYSYQHIFEPDGMKMMAANFRVFCDRKNYPVYFHCIAGADRTGALAYVLNGVLGVRRQELETDWESTFYPKIPNENPDPNFWHRELRLNDGFSKYGDADTSWDERIVLYLKDCGITDAEIETFRDIMLEPKAGTDKWEKGVGRERWKHKDCSATPHERTFTRESVNSI